MCDEEPKTKHERKQAALALGAGLRAAGLTAVKVSDILSDDDGAVRSVQNNARR